MLTDTDWDNKHFYTLYVQLKSYHFQEKYYEMGCHKCGMNQESVAVSVRIYLLRFLDQYANILVLRF